MEVSKELGRDGTLTFRWVSDVVEGLEEGCERRE
jgi:hypothetical protein